MCSGFILLAWELGRCLWGKSPEAPGERDWTLALMRQNPNGQCLGWKLKKRDEIARVGKAWAWKSRVLAFLKYPERSCSQKRYKTHIITTAKFAVIHTMSNESTMKSITNAYLQLEMCGIADLVVYERSKYGNMKEINTPHFKCLGFF